uniref:Reverse transcriptase domain-containing protein n=1 Tax=Tanacetum cinerariifolium TaxID=118510 RepID=A0A6L2MVY4_TANCI|nr:reverse transcriptase domain-containing protein [Tanacetum cinerariifolium]
MVVRLVVLHMLIMIVKLPVATLKRTYMLLRVPIMRVVTLTNLKERPQGVLPSNIVLNPRDDLKAITTHSGVTLARPSVTPLPLSSSKEVEHDPESTTKKVLTESTTIVPPLPSRLNKEKLQDKPDIQIHSFLQMLKKLYFNISFAEALAHMPKNAKMVKDLLTKKDKLLELENTPLNENCSAFLLKKLPKKLGDTGRFLIPCDFYRLESCMALADLGRPFLRTDYALVDVYGEELTLRDEKLVFNIEITSKYPQKHGDESIHKSVILDITCEDHFHEIDTFLAFVDSISPNINDGIFDLEGDICLIEELLNNEIQNDLPPLFLVFEINETEMIKNSIDYPPNLELKDLPPHREYTFLEETSKLPVIIAKDLKREEKE